MKNKILILFIILFPAIAFSQEIITGLYTNPVIKAKAKDIQAEKPRSFMLSIPFVDDFSGKSIFPNDTLWSDKYVFINSSYQYLPPTIGVATFDALNDTGALYPEASSFGFTADSLTSNPIRLDSIIGPSPTPLKISDSIYFSFYYQPQGMGNAPETDDSLVLEFFSPKANQWIHIWADTGSTLQQFHSRYKMWFRQVMIPITDSVNYFQKGFRFRFYNYASLANSSLPSWASGNIDIWNLDYVYLNKSRNKADSFYRDIAFVDPAPSMLKNYTAMPWSQYKIDTTAEMIDSLHMIINNLGNDTVNSSYHYIATEIESTWDTLCNAGSFNILPLSIQAYHTSPKQVFTHFPSNSNDSAEFIITHACNGVINGDIRKQNDTTIFDQKFFDYYAYDDGVPEAGYGLSPANSMLAYKFTLNHPDTLRAVKMFFNQTLNNASQQYFYLTVWKDASGYPGDTLYQQKGLKPEYQDSLNKFIWYRIDNRKVLVSGTFYVGWKQMTDDNLNLGYDLNTDEHTKIFYNTGSGWMNSSYAGALMIRPVLGKVLPVYTGIPETQENNDKIQVYPNPSNGENIFIKFPDKIDKDVSTLTIRLFDMLGNEVFKSSFTNNINISNLQNGIYLLSVTSNDGRDKYFTRIAVIK